jgi:hypothetical protein
MAGDFVELIIHRTDALSRLQACPDQRPLAKDREPLRNRAWGNQSHEVTKSIDARQGGLFNSSYPKEKQPTLRIGSR